uniref:Uncharacterized protein n=1 Tax=Arion vulgaris TaxID=1028688 RepID=A0A0B6ZL22_9EUPU
MYFDSTGKLGRKYDQTVLFPSLRDSMDDLKLIIEFIEAIGALLSKPDKSNNATAYKHMQIPLYIVLYQMAGTQNTTEMLSKKKKLLVL